MISKKAKQYNEGHWHNKECGHTTEQIEYNDTPQDVHTVPVPGTLALVLIGAVSVAVMKKFYHEPGRKGRKNHS